MQLQEQQQPQHLELAKLTNTLAAAGSAASSDVAIVAMTQKRQIQ
jgi:hypothetical protein